MIADLELMTDPQNTVSMDERTNLQPQPGQAVFYRLEIATAGRNIEFHYTARKVWNGISSHDDFKDKMTVLIANQGGDIGNVRPRRTRDNNAGPANRSKDTHLSINFENMPPSYIVLKLSSRYNWQFSRAFAPFTMDRRDQGYHRFFDARRFNAAGDVIENSVLENNCRFAYFTVDPTKFVANAQGEFQHRFNIHIDLLEMDGSTIDSFIPIIIDPDVRHPGGNGSP